MSQTRPAMAAPCMNTEQPMDDHLMHGRFVEEGPETWYRG